MLGVGQLEEVLPHLPHGPGQDPLILQHGHQGDYLENFRQKSLFYYEQKLLNK